MTTKSRSFFQTPSLEWHALCTRAGKQHNSYLSMIIHAYDRSATNWIVIKTCTGIVKKILLSMLVNQCNEKSGQCLSVLLQLPLERFKTMTIRKSIAHPSQHHLLQVIFYEIHLVVSGKSVSILKRQLLWTGRFYWFSFFPLRNTPQLMWIVDS